MYLVGLPETSVWPARARIRAAILNSGTAWPDARITVSVAPVIPPVYDAAADLALAVALVAAAGVTPAEQITGGCPSVNWRLMAGYARSEASVRQQP